MSENITYRIVTQVQQTVERVYEISVSADENEDDIRELVEGGNVPLSLMVEESDAEDGAIKALKVTNVTEKDQQKCAEEAANTEQELKQESGQDSVGRF